MSWRDLGTKSERLSISGAVVRRFFEAAIATSTGKMNHSVDTHDPSGRSDPLLTDTMLSD